MRWRVTLKRSAPEGPRACFHILTNDARVYSGSMKHVAITLILFLGILVPTPASATTSVVFFDGISIYYGTDTMGVDADFHPNSALTLQGSSELCKAFLSN